MKNILYSLAFIALIGLSSCSQYGYLTTSYNPKKQPAKEHPRTTSKAPARVAEEKQIAATPEIPEQEISSLSAPAETTVIKITEPAIATTNTPAGKITSAKTSIQKNTFSGKKISPLTVQKTVKALKKSEPAKSQKTMGLLGLLGFLLIIIGLVILFLVNIVLGILLCLLGLLFILVGKL